MIRIRELQFHYPRSTFRLAIPALDIDQGERLAVVGPSGSGKTTLLRLVAGISVPDAGDIQVHDFAVASASEAARRNFRIRNIGFVFQEFELIDYLSVTDNILFPYFINKKLKLTKDIRAQARQLAEDMGLGERLANKPEQLSQGERQRVAICRAVLRVPQILLADEPTGNLDPDNKQKIVDLLFQQAERAGATLVMVTHDHSLLDDFPRKIDFADFRAGGGEAT